MSTSEHDHRCANASRTSHKSCKCACQARLHGVPNSNRTNALLIANSNNDKAKVQSQNSIERCKNNYKKARRSLKTKKCSDLAASIAINTVIHDKDANDLIALIDTLSSTITSSFIDTVTSYADLEGKSLTREQINSFSDMITKCHLLCKICCKILELFNKTEKEICKQVESLVTQYLKTYFPALNETVKMIIIAASKATAKKMFDIITESSQIDNAKRALQLIALIFCPDYSEHREVLDHCFKPLIQSPIEEEISNYLNKEFGTIDKGFQKINPIKQSTGDQKNDLTTSEIDTSSDACEQFSSQQYLTAEAEGNDPIMPHTESNT